LNRSKWPPGSEFAGAARLLLFALVAVIAR
jgi:hypothetical protein